MLPAASPRPPAVSLARTVPSQERRREEMREKVDAADAQVQSLERILRQLEADMADDDGGVGADMGVRVARALRRSRGGHNGSSMTESDGGATSSFADESDGVRVGYGRPSYAPEAYGRSAYPVRGGGTGVTVIGADDGRVVRLAAPGSRGGYQGEDGGTGDGAGRRVMGGGAQEDGPWPAPSRDPRGAASGRTSYGGSRASSPGREWGLGSEARRTADPGPAQGAGTGSRVRNADTSDASDDQEDLGPHNQSKLPPGARVSAVSALSSGTGGQRDAASAVAIGADDSGRIQLPPGRPPPASQPEGLRAPAPPHAHVGGRPSDPLLMRSASSADVVGGTGEDRGRV